AEDGIRDFHVTGVQTCALPISRNGTVIEGANEQTLNITGPGTYRVTVTTAEGCEGSDVIVVTPGEPAIITDITVGPDYVIVEARSEERRVGKEWGGRW